MSNEPKPFVAFGRGYSGTFDTREEAEAVVERNGNGGVYVLIESRHVPAPPPTEVRQCVNGNCGQCDRIEDFMADKRKGAETNS